MTLSETDASADQTRPPVGGGAAIAFVGVGAVGGYFASRAVAAGADVRLCVRTPFDELVVESAEGRRAMQVQVLVDPAAAEPVDWVVVATKAHQTPTVAAWLTALVARHTAVLVLQNGVEHESRIRPLVPDHTAVVPSVVYCGAFSPAPGVVRHDTYGFAHVPDTHDAQRVASVFGSGEEVIRPAADFNLLLWQKLCSNAAANAITALTRSSLAVLRRRDVGTLAVQLMEECAEVARAEGVDIGADFPRETLERLRSLPNPAGTSMQYDALAQRPLEADAINGAVARFAERHGVRVPLNVAVLALLEGLGAGFAPRGS